MISITPLLRFLFLLSLFNLTHAEVKGQEERLPFRERDSYLRAAEHSIAIKQHPLFQRFQEDGGAEYSEAEAKLDPLIYGGAIEAVSKGFTALSWVTKAIVTIIFLPIILPIILVPLILIGLLIFFLPVIRIELGPTDDVARKLGRVGRVLKEAEGTARFLYSVSEKDECLEKIACEVGRASPLFSVPAAAANWIRSKIEGSEIWGMKRLARSLRLASQKPDCSVFRCNVRRQLGSFLKAATGSKEKPN